MYGDNTTPVSWLSHYPPMPQEGAAVWQGELLRLVSLFSPGQLFFAALWRALQRQAIGAWGVAFR